MNKSVHAILATFAIAAFARFAAAAPVAETASFAAPFTAHAVLQRDCPLPVWGFATPGAEVTVKLDGDARSAVAGDDGAWKVVFPAQTEPGLGHRLALSSGDTVFADLEDIAVGDVWICSGQSNMDMSYGWGLTRGREDVEKADYPDIRVFDDKDAASFHPQTALSRPAEWLPCTFDNVRNFSACAFFFAQALREKLPGVPIGLVEASWSGSPIQTWLSAEAYSSADPACEAEIASLRQTVENYEKAGGREAYQAALDAWNKDVAAKTGLAAEAEDFDDADWAAVAVPSSFEQQFAPDFDGCVWYRRTFDLTAEQAAAEGAVLALGAIDDIDDTYVNGRHVGRKEVWNEPREYPVPAGLLREGRNTVAVKAVDLGGGGGFVANELTPVQLRFANAEAVPLDGEWRALAARFDPRPASPDASSWTPTACYNAMLHPLFPMAAKGAIWYQGCSNVGGAQRYDKVLRAMVADWREHFTHPDGFPFYIVQLAAFLDTHPQPVESAWAEMRWTQMKLGETVGKSGTAVAIDVGDHGDIHPKDKKTVGERLSRLALVRTYGLDGIVEAGPIPLSAKAADGAVEISFKNAAGLAASDGGALAGFQLAGEDGVFVQAEATIDGGKVRLSIPEGMEPARVRYAWDDYPACNLVGADGLPCGPFELTLDR